MSFRHVILAVILLVTLPAFARGDEFSVVPSVSVKEEYNSNVLFTTDVIRRDFVTTLSPSVEIMNRTYRLDTDLLLRLDQLVYADNAYFNATNQMYDGRFRYLLTPLLAVAGEAGYMRNSNPTLDIGTTGIVLAAVPLTRITASLSADYQLTELAAASISYNYGRDYFENARFSDDITHDVNATLAYDLGKYFPSVQGKMNVGFSDYTFSDLRMNSVVGKAGLSWDFNEVGSVLAEGGLRRTWSEVPSTRLKEAGWGWVGDVSLKYRGERSTGDLTYAVDITPAYGLNGAAERDALTLSAQDRLTDELSVLFAAGYYRLKPVSGFSAQTIDQRTFRINPGVRYEFSRDVVAEASYEYTMVDYPATSREASRQLFSVRLCIQHHFFD